MSKGLHRQRGVALITALAVVALATAIASDLIWRTFLDQQRTEAVLHGAQSRQYLRGVEDWVGHILRRDAEETDFDSLDQPWAQELPPLPVDGGQIVGRLEDAQGRFNLNNLINSDGTVNEESLKFFERLLMNLELNPELSRGVVDWIDADQEPVFPGGAEDGVYLGLQPAYRAGNQGIQTVSELRMINGFQEAEVYEAIAPYVTALPSSLDSTPINVNTAPAPILRSLADNIQPDRVQNVIERQQNGGFESNDQFADAVGINIPVPFSVGTNFFLLTARADIGSASATMYSLLFRNDAGATAAVLRSYGTR